MPTPTFNVTPAKQQQLIERMARLGVREDDLVEKFVRGSGPGGQKINKTSICVHLLHKPSGIEVRCARERSQSTNRFLARRLLCDRLEDKTGAGPATRRAAKVRKQKHRRARRRQAADG